jgi:hypothetical protein
VAACLLALAVAVAAAAAPGRAERDLRLREVRAELVRAGLDQRFDAVVEPPFVLVGDLGRRELDRWAADTVRPAVRLLRQDFFDRDPDQLVTVWLLRDATSYRRQAERLLGAAPPTPYGFWLERERTLLVNAASGDGTLVHEIVHPFLAADFPAAPPWLDEGLGSLFERSAVRDGHIVGLVNWRLEALQEAVRRDTLPPLAALLAADRDRFHGHDPGQSYAHARYLLYYLQDKGRLVAFYRRFRDHHRDDPTGRATLLAVLGAASLEPLDDDWRRWLLALGPAEPVAAERARRRFPPTALPGPP